MLEHQDIQKKPNSKKKKHQILEVKDYLDLKYEFRRNDLTLEVEYRPVEEKRFQVLDEARINSIWIELQVDGFKVSDAVLIKILNSHLVKNHHPLKAYFETLPDHDGVDHIQKLAESVQIDEVSVENVHLQQLWKPYLQKWLVGSVATVLGQGTNQLCLILAGGQGIGKTTWLNRLCPKGLEDFLVCSHINPSLTDNNTANYLAEKWFVNIDDQLETIFGKDFNSMKAIITAPFVTNRKTWHRFSRKRDRVCSFMGSVNNTQFLTDNENRRYLVFKVNGIHFDHKIEMAKVWAQALHLLKQGFPYWFQQEEMRILNVMNNLFRQSSPEEEWLIRLYEPTTADNPLATFLMPSEILTKLNAYSNMKLSIRKLNMAMEKLGFNNKVSKRIHGQPRYVHPVIEHLHSSDMQYQHGLRSEEV
ncbi:VapE domain-containing protein [Marinoscillum luteum]|uniref:VapE domain-containing protein n=1 Tax=Marinoscillum luteum TaxID=861051 RepID=A0ABW7N7P7_9BACT